MIIDRRDMLVAGIAGAALASLPLRLAAQDAEAKTAEQVIADFTGGAAPADTGVTLTAPEIAENGNTVPIGVEAPGATDILVVAAGNPVPEVATFTFGALAGAQAASTRIRLAKTQDVIVVAKLADGSFAQATSNVKVTIGGCGG